MGSPYDSFSTQFAFPQHNGGDFRLRGSGREPPSRFGAASGFRSQQSSSSSIGSLTQILTFGVFIYVFFAIASIAQGAKDGGFRAGTRANPFPNDNSNPQLYSSGTASSANQQDPGKYFLTPEQQAEYQRWLLEKQRHREVLQQHEQYVNSINQNNNSNRSNNSSSSQIQNSSNQSPVLGFVAPTPPSPAQSSLSSSPVPRSSGTIPSFDNDYPGPGRNF